MQITLFAGSLRKDSWNKKLLAVAASLAAQGGATIQIVDLQPLAIPVYDGDIEAAGIPDGVKRLEGHVRAAAGLIISSPEYNGAISSPLKNAIDWLSRLKPIPLERKPVLLMAASPGAMAGIRALTNERVPFEALGAYVFPQAFGLGKCTEAFTAQGGLQDPKQSEKLQSLIVAYLDFCKRLNS